MNALHLPTMVVALSYSSLLFLVGFLYFGTKENWGSGTRWWTLNAVTTVAVPLLLTLWPVAVDSPAFWLGSLLLHLNSFFNWAGVNAHLGRPPRWRAVAIAFAFVTVPYWVAREATAHSFLLWFISGYVASLFYTSGSMYRTITHYQRQTGTNELNFVRWVSASDVCIAVAVLLFLWLPQPLPEQSPAWFFWLEIIYLITMGLRMSSYFVTYLQDLHKSIKQERQAFQAKSVELQSLVQNLGAGVLVLSGDRCQVVLINEAGRRFFEPLGLEATQTSLPLNQWRFWSADLEPIAVEDTLFQRPMDPDDVLRELVMGMAMGDAESPSCWGLFGAYAVQEAGQPEPGLLVTLVDITALRQAQQQEKLLQQRLAESSRMRSLGTLAGGVAHDFNNLLTAILGHLQLLREGFDAPVARDAPAMRHEEWIADQRISVDAILVAARRGRELVRQVLSFGRNVPSNMLLCDPVHVLNETLMLLRVGLPPTVQLEVRIMEPIPPIVGDGNQLSQVWLNLCSNALQALPKGVGRVEVVLDSLPAESQQVPAEIAQRCREVNGRAVRVRVSDNGLGMDAQTMSQMFEPFFTTKPAGQGTGLGLSVVYGIVQAHGGVIQADSRPGKGSCFSVWLPGLSGAGPAAVPSNAPHSQEAGEPLPSVLYLDDEEAVALVVQRLLRTAGHACQTFTQPDEALQWLQDPANKVDILLTDFRMPQMTGVEFADKALAMRPDLPVVVMSGFVDDQLEIQAKARGIRSVLHKTDNIEELSVALNRLWRA